MKIPPPVASLLSGVLRVYSPDLQRLVRVADPLLVMALFWLLVCQNPSDPVPGNEKFALVNTILVGLFTTLILPQGKLYQSYRQTTLWALLRRITTSWALVLGALMFVAFLSKNTATFSRVDVSIWVIVSWAALLALHVGGRKLLRWHRIKGGNTRTILYWGLPRDAEVFHQRLQNHPYLGLRMVAWFGPEPPGPGLHLPSDLPPYGGQLPDLRRWLNSHNVDQIVFSYLSRSDISMQDLIRFFGDTCLPVIYAPSWVEPGMVTQVMNVGDQCCIQLWQSQASGLDRRLKRCFDLVVAGPAVLLLSPLLLLIALAIRCTSPGPVLFLQDRYGLDGKRFRIYKFRTMNVLDAGDQTGLRQATRHDPRLTPLGAFLRHWSLDELPQLFNVLQGDMSLVGPRPHAVEHNEHYRQLIPGYMQRHLFKPGITGLAQVKGFRGETSSLTLMAHRVEADLEYQRDWSITNDIKILIRTVLNLHSPSAY